MTGEYIPLKTLRQEWDAAVLDDCKSAASALGAPRAALSQSLRHARSELARSGVVAQGDILYLATDPVRVGHVIPPHYNHTLGRSVGRELALTAPLGFPPGIPGNTDLVIYRRSGENRWEAETRSVCLGSVPSVAVGQEVADAGINLLAFLRFGAIRIAGNGRFHEYEGREG
jgi:hypothetical protein